MIGFYISGSITLIVYLLQFIFAFLEMDKTRKAIKPFCLIGLMITVYFLGCRNILLFLALGFGLIGDIFLIFPKKKICFILGIVTFYINHILYIVLFSQLLSYPIKPWIIIGLIVFGLLFPLLTYKLSSSISKDFALPGGIYFYALFIECLFATLLLMDSKSGYAIMILFGNISFIISDTILSLTNFVIKVKRKDFYIMTTYLLAQTLISIGLTLMLIGWLGG